MLPVSHPKVQVTGFSGVRSVNAQLTPNKDSLKSIDDACVRKSLCNWQICQVIPTSVREHRSKMLAGKC